MSRIFVVLLLLALSLSLRAEPPSNDPFADPEPIGDALGDTTGNNEEATLEPGEPIHGGTGVVGGASVWYTWIAPVTGAVGFNTAGSDIDTILAAYEGDTLLNLTRVANSDDFIAGATDSQIYFSCVEGEIYYIAVDGKNGQQGFFNLSWEAVEGDILTFSTANYRVGEAAGRVTVTVRRVGPLVGSIDLFLFTSDGISPTGGSATESEDYTGIERTFTLAAGQGARSFDISIINDTEPEDDEAISVDFLVEGASETAVFSEGAVRADITITDNDDPGNDDLIDAAQLIGGSGTVTGTNQGADAETGEPNHGDRSIWYRWTPPNNGVVRFDVSQSSSFPVSVYAYTGNAVNALTLVTGGTEQIAFPAVFGTTYRIAVTNGTNFEGFPGEITLDRQYVSSGSLFTVLSDRALARERAGEGLRMTVLRQPTGQGLTQTQSVQYRLLNGSATSPNDFPPTVGTVTFLSGETSKTIIVPVTDDTLVEGTEVLIFELFNPTGGFTNIPNAAVVQLLDDDDDPINNEFANATLLVGLSGTVSGTTEASDTQFGEPLVVMNGGHSVWYRWVAPVTGPARFSVSATNLIPKIGAFQGASVTTLTPLGVPGASVAFLAAQGQTYFFSVDAENLSTGAFTLQFESEAAGTFALQSIAAVQESIGQVVLTVLRENGDGGAVSVAYTASSGSATAGADFTLSSGVLQFADGETSKTIMVPIVDDTLDELEETFQVTLSNPQGGASITVASQTVQILDNDAPANDGFASAQQLSGNTDSEISTNDGATRESNEPDHGEGTVWFRWTAPSAGVVALDTTGSSAPGTGLFAYTGAALAELALVQSASTRVVFVAASQTEYRFAVTAGVAAGMTRGTIQLNLQFVPGGSLFQFGTVFAQGREKAGAGVTFLAHRTITDPSTVHTIPYVVASGTANKDTDLVASAGLITFPAGVENVSFTVAATNDQLLEGDEEFSVSLGQTTNGFAIAPLSATGRLLDDEDDPVNNDLAAATLLSGASGNAAGTNAFSDTEVNEPALAGGGRSVWYRWIAPVSGPASFGITSAAALRLVVFERTSPTTLRALSSVTLTHSFIAKLNAEYVVGVDGLGDETGAFDLSYTSASAGTFRVDKFVTVNEAIGTVSVTVTRSDGSAGAVSLAYTTARASSGRTAIEDLDFTTVTGTLEFADGQLAQTVQIPILEDTLDELDETFLFLISAPTNGGLLGTESLTILLVDNDLPTNDSFASPIQLSGNSSFGETTNTAATREQGEPAHGDATVWFRWTAPGTGAAQVSTLASGATGLQTSIYRGTALETLVPLAQSARGLTAFFAEAGVEYRVAVSVRPDAVSPVDGRVQVHLVFINGGSVFQFASVRHLGREKNGAGVILNFTRQSPGTTSVEHTVDYSIPSGGDDLSVISGTVRFAPGVQSVAVTIPAITDAVLEGDEEFFASLLAPTPGFASDQGTIITLFDDEDDPVNNDFANASAFNESVITFQQTINGSNVGADLEADESPVAANGLRTVWYRWKALAAGTVQLAVSAPGFAASTRAVEGAGAVGSTILANGDETTAASFTAVAGHTYHIAVDGAAAASGAFALTLQFTSTDAPGTIRFVQSAITGAENAGGVTISLERIGGTAGTVSARVRSLMEDPLDVALLAEPGVDYTALEQTVVFAPGQTTGSVTLGLLNDSADEVNETLALALDLPTGGATLGAEAIFTIVDDDGVQFANAAATFSGFIFDAADFGTATFKTTVTGAFSGKLDFGERSFSFKGKLDLSGRGEVSIPRKRGELPLLLVFNVLSGDQVAGTLTIDGVEARIRGSRAVYSKLNPAPQEGKFSVFFRPPVPATPVNRAGYPQAPGFAAMTVAKTGGVKLAAKLPDGSKLSLGGALDAQGRYTYFKALAKRVGHFAGQLDFTGNDAAAGTGKWVLPSALKGLYPGGFTIDMTCSAHRYTPPGRGLRVLTALDASQGAATTTLRNAADLQPDEQTVNVIFTIKSTAQSLDRNLKVSINAASGLITGTYVNSLDPPLAKPRKLSLQGIVNQQNQTGEGFFLGITEAGSFQVAPSGSLPQ